MSLTFRELIALRALFSYMFSIAIHEGGDVLKAGLMLTCCNNHMMKSRALERKSLVFLPTSEVERFKRRPGTSKITMS